MESAGHVKLPLPSMPQAACRRCRDDGSPCSDPSVCSLASQFDCLSAKECTSAEECTGNRTLQLAGPSQGKPKLQGKSRRADPKLP